MRGISGSTHWADISEAGSLWGIRFLLFCYKLGGKALFKVFLAPVIIYFYLVRSTNRQASLAYIYRIKQQLPEYASKNAYLLSFAHFWNFALSLIDKIAVWCGDIDITDTTSHGGELITRLCDEQKGAILLITHLGNFEICRALSQHRKNFRLTVLMHTKHAENFNKLLTRSIKSSSKVDVIQVSEISPATAMMINERIERGEFIAISGDRVAIANPQNSFGVQFMGETAPLPSGPFTLAAILKAPLISIVCIREKNRYQIYFDQISERVSVSRKQRNEKLAELAQSYANLLEKYCLQAPLQWFNFYDFWQRPNFGDRQHD